MEPQFKARFVQVPTPLQDSSLENPRDWGAWWAAGHGVTKSRTQLSDFIFTFHFPALEKEMATHSSVLAWRIPGMGEPGGLPSMGSHRVGHDWSDLAAAAALQDIKKGSLLPTFLTCRFSYLFLSCRRILCSNDQIQWHLSGFIQRLLPMTSHVCSNFFFFYFLSR